MEIWQSIVPLIEAALTACAWPVTLITLILLFKKPLQSLLGRVKRLKAPWAELELSEQLEEVTEALEEAKAPEEERKEVIYELIDEESAIEGNVVLAYKTSITPSEISQGDSYITHVEFKGIIHNGFFTNKITGVDSDFRLWNPDRNTIPLPGHTEAGNLNGYVDIKTQYPNETKTWPKGRFEISVRLYSHRIRGKRGRVLIREEKHQMVVE